MLMRHWSPSSPVPTPVMDYDTTPSSKQRTCLRWCKLIISAFIPMILFSFFLVYLLQQETFFNDKYRHEQENEYNRQQQNSFDTYINDISNILLSMPDKNPLDEKYLLHIQTKTLSILRSLDLKRKKDIILFLYERNLIQNNLLDLHGADLNDVQLTCPRDFNHLYLPGVSWAKAVFINCQLTNAIFNQAYLADARFLNSTLQNASFSEAILDHSDFTQTIILNANFNGASLIEADFVQAEIVQGNNFRNADLFQAKLTDHQLQGKYISIIDHDFSHARFPNGSFGELNSKQNLVLNGDAEMECLSSNQSKWTTVNSNMTLTTENVANENITNENATVIDSDWGKYLFLISVETRVYQDINLHSYSLLIDTDNAAFTFSAFASCDQSYFEINMYRFDGILHRKTSYPNYIDETHPMKLYGTQQYHIPIRTRSVRIFFGVQTSKSSIQCYFDNISFTIHQNRKN